MPPPVGSNPTAQTLVADTAVTPVNPVNGAEPRFGAGTTSHAVPSQCSMSGPAKPFRPPTAQTSVGDTADTLRKESFAPVEAAPGTTFHAAPSQCSMI